jgi:hypothetical protein
VRLLISFGTFVEALVPESGKLGSNEGGVHVDDATGEKHYVKWYRDPQQGRTEVLTSRIYNRMGIPTVEPKLDHVNGREAVVSRWRNDLTTKKPHEWDHVNEHQAIQIGKLYHAAVLTKNWDVVGLDHDNIMQHRDTGQIHAIDHGGAFHFRAMGSSKPYGPDIDDHHTLRHGLPNAPSTSINPTARLFGNTFSKFPHAPKAGLEAVRNLDMDGVKHDFETSGLHNWEDLHRNFTARRERLLRHYE